MNFRNFFQREKENPLLGVSVSVIIKIVTVLLSFITVPIMMNILNSRQYSLWVTLTSIVTWLAMLDFGVGNGLKTKVAQSQKDDDDVKQNIVGTFLFFVIVSVVTIFALVVFRNKIPIIQDNVFLALFLYIPVVLTLPLTVFSAILQGKCENTLLSFISLIRYVWILLIVPVAYFCNGISLFFCAVFYNIFYLVYYAFIIISVKKYFTFKFRDFLHFASLTQSFSLIKIGLKFFVLQISSIILYNTGNYIVYNFFKEQVISYDIMNKIYTNVFQFFNIGIAVYWSQYSMAYGNRDYKKFIILRKQLRMQWLVFLCALLCVAAATPLFIKIWTVGKVNVSYIQTLPFFIMISMQSFCYLNAVVLNATNQLNVQIVLSVINDVLYFVGVFLCTKYFPSLGYLIIPILTSITMMPVVFVLSIKAKQIEKSLIA
jgi:O-antigen/teichoic acid export membrane protein